MTTEWAFAFLNTAVIIFCLRYSLNVPHQTPSFFPVQDAVSIFSKFRYRRHFTTPCHMEDTHCKILCRSSEINAKWRVEFFYFWAFILSVIIFSAWLKNYVKCLNLQCLCWVFLYLNILERTFWIDFWIYHGGWPVCKISFFM